MSLRGAFCFTALCEQAVSLQQLAATLQQQMRAEAAQQHRDLGGILLQAIDALASMQRTAAQPTHLEPLGSPLPGPQSDTSSPTHPHTSNPHQFGAHTTSAVSPAGLLAVGAEPVAALQRIHAASPIQPVARSVLAAQRTELLARLQAAQLAVATEQRLDLLAAAGWEIQALTVAIMQMDAELQVRGNGCELTCALTNGHAGTDRGG